MVEEISKMNAATLKARLKLPLAVRDLLVTGLAPDTDMRFALAEEMSDMKPVEALLCAAFCVLDIVTCAENPSGQISYAAMECNHLIVRYQNLAHTSIAFADLPILAEDLEHCAEMLELCHMTHEILYPHTAPLFDVLRAQIHTQSLIIDEVLCMYKAQEEHKNLGMIAALSASDNVVNFPTRSH